MWETCLQRKDLSLIEFRTSDDIRNGQTSEALLGCAVYERFDNEKGQAVPQ